MIFDLWKLDYPKFRVIHDVKGTYYMQVKWTWDRDWEYYLNRTFSTPEEAKRAAAEEYFKKKDTVHQELNRKELSYWRKL